MYYANINGNENGQVIRTGINQNDGGGKNEGR